MIEPEIARRLSRRVVDEDRRTQQREFRLTMAIIFLALVSLVVVIAVLELIVGSRIGG